MKLYRAFDLNEYQMDFVVNVEGIYDSEVKQRGGKVYTTPLRTNHPFKSFWELKNVVSKGEYNYVLKLCDTPIGVIDVIAAKLGGATRVGVRSCNASSNMSTIKKLLCSALRPLLNYLTDYKIAPSELAGRYTFGNHEFEKGNVKIINNGIQFENYKYDESKRNDVRKQYGIEKGFVVGHIGRFAQQKNHEFLIKVFVEFLKLNKHAVLLLIGSGELEGTIRNWAKEYEIEERIVFAGVQMDVQAYLSAMDCFLLPSFFEGLPNTVVEAQANGLCCFLSDSITKEVNITDSVHFFSLADSPKEWAIRINKLCEIKRMNSDFVLKQFIKRGYDIESVRKVFLSIVFNQ